MHLNAVQSSTVIGYTEAMKHFYTRKLETLRSMQARVAALREELAELTQAEEGVAVGTFEEMGDMTDALDNLEEIVDGLAVAVEPLAEAAERSVA